MISTTEAMATTEELAAFLKLRPQTIRSWRSKGEGPEFHTIGNKVRYDMAEVREWLAQQRGPKTTWSRSDLHRLVQAAAFCFNTSKNAVPDYFSLVLQCEHPSWYDAKESAGEVTPRCRECRCDEELAFVLGVKVPPMSDLVGAA